MVCIEMVTFFNRYIRVSNIKSLSGLFSEMRVKSSSMSWTRLSFIFKSCSSRIITLPVEFWSLWFCPQKLPALPLPCWELFPHHYHVCSLTEDGSFRTSNEVSFHAFVPRFCFRHKIRGKKKEKSSLLGSTRAYHSLVLPWTPCWDVPSLICLRSCTSDCINIMLPSGFCWHATEIKCSQEITDDVMPTCERRDL